MKKLLIGFMGLTLLAGCGQQADYLEVAPEKIIEVEEANNEIVEGALGEPVEGSYILDTTASQLFWKGLTPVKSHEGTIAIESGNLSKIDDIISGEFIIDMNGIVVTDIPGGGQGLIDHLENEDFFNVAEFPTSSFEITSSEKKSDDVYAVTGDLTIKGITNPITFDMDLEEGGSLNASADFTIDRTLWDIRYGSGKFFENLGNKIINDDMEMKLDLKFQ